MAMSQLSTRHLPTLLRSHGPIRPTTPTSLPQPAPRAPQPQQSTHHSQCTTRKSSTRPHWALSCPQVSHVCRHRLAAPAPCMCTCWEIQLGRRVLAAHVCATAHVPPVPRSPMFPTCPRSHLGPGAGSGHGRGRVLLLPKATRACRSFPEPCSGHAAPWGVGRLHARHVSVSPVTPLYPTATHAHCDS